VDIFNISVPGFFGRKIKKSLVNVLLQSYLFTCEKSRHILIFSALPFIFCGYASFWHLAIFTLQQN